MNILVMGDVHGDIENVIELLDKVAMLDFDCIVYSGDFTDFGISLKGFKSTEVVELLLEEIGSLGKPVLAIPGNHDRDIIPMLEKKGVSLHGRGKIIDGLGFYGFGGAKTPFGTPFEPSEKEIKEGLEAGYREIEKAKMKIQVTHIPPVGTKLDVVYTGAHTGSQAVRDFIESKHPIVAISAHIHEARGLDEIGNTKLINPGRFPEGYCGMISIGKEGVTTKIINLI